MFRATHPLYPPLDVPFSGGVWGPFTGTHDDGAAPLSPILQGAIAGLHGTLTPPQSPSSHSQPPAIQAMEREMQSINESTPCPASPYVVPEPTVDAFFQTAYDAIVDYQAPQWVETAPGVFVPYTQFTDPYAAGSSGVVTTDGPSTQHTNAGPHQGQQYAHEIQDTLPQDQDDDDQGDPVFAMISRYQDDHGDYDESNRSYQNQTNDVATRIVPTGIREVDEPTNEYYNMKPRDTYIRQARSSIAYRFPVEVIQTLQKNLKKDWQRVMPPPIPAVIIKPFDCICVSDLQAAQDGWAYVVPSEDTIWGAILERGVDHYYRPLAKDHATSEPIPVQTKASVFGAAVYLPQDIVASNFAINVFRELPKLPGPGGSLDVPMAEYLGAFILLHANNLCMTQDTWEDLSEEIKAMLVDQAPHLFEGFPPYEDVPDVPVVFFRYYRWDSNIIGLADEIHGDYLWCRAMALANEGAGEDDHDEDLFSDAEDQTSSDDDSSFLDMDSA